MMAHKCNPEVKKALLHKCTHQIHVATDHVSWLTFANVSMFCCPVQARSFIQQLLESVAFMHGLGLVHTDLKPENILLRSQASIRVPQPPGSK